MVIFLHRTHAYGYDGGASCNPKASRRGRAQFLENIPCDLTVQSYCNRPGSLYPWNAVRRFVHENQGLMRRMYGDVKHISVLRTEVNNNDIEFDDVEQATARYSRSGWKRNKYLYSDLQKTKVNSVVSEPHFRPTSTSPKTTTTSSSSTTIAPSTTEFPFITDNEVVAQDNTTTINTPLKSIFVGDNDTNSVKDYKIHQPSDIKIPNNKSEAATISTTLRIFLPPKVSQASITPPDNDETNSTTEYGEDDVNDSNEHSDRPNDQTSDNNRGEAISDATPKQANLRPNDSMEGQLFQDVVPKEEPIYNSRGV